MDCLFINNQIAINIEVQSLLGNLKKEVTAIIDTGFAGDLQLTYEQAFPLGLTLKGFTTWTLADESSVNFLECLGQVNFNKKSVTTSIDVKPSGSNLIGVSLLKKLGCQLNIDFVKEKAQIQTK